MYQTIKKIPNTQDIKRMGNSYSFTYTGNINQLTKFLAKHDLKHLTIHDADLETIFMQFYKGKNVK